MHLALFGATGRTGRPLLRQALQRGHTVTAFVRSPDTLAEQHGGVPPGVTVVEGTVADADAVARAVEGADAVLLALGHAAGSPKDVMAAAADHIVHAMQHHGVRRLITLTGAGVRQPIDRPGFGDKLMRRVLGLVAPALLRDSEAHVRRLQESGLDVTVVRAPRLLTGDATGRYETAPTLQMGLSGKIVRADVADFMLQAAENSLFVNEAPMIQQKA